MFQPVKTLSGRKAGRRASGFTLIELMIAMLLGLIVIAGVVSVFLANQRVYRANQGLGEVQDGTRIAFEMMAHDIRNAGFTGCNSNGRVANVLNNGPIHGGTDWWANWSNAVMGYSSGDPAATAASNQVSGTDSIMLLGGSDSSFAVSSYVSPTFILNDATSDLQNGDVVIVCDPDHAVLFQISSYSSPASGVTFAHSLTGTTPGNCSNGLGIPTVCTAGGTPYTFLLNSQVTKFVAADWYIGANPDGGKSLYRVGMDNNPQEMVRDVTNMTITYHQSPNPDFVATTAVTNWGAVNAAQVTLALESTDKHSGTDVKPISRTFTATTTVRNRVK